MADHTPRTGPDRTGDPERRVQVAVTIGWLLVGIGVVDGIILMVRRREAPCADGTYFTEGTTDFTCYTHPQLGLGVAVVVISLLLGILVWLASLSASTLLRREASTQL